MNTLKNSDFDALNSAVDRLSIDLSKRVVNPDILDMVTSNLALLLIGDENRLFVKIGNTLRDAESGKEVFDVSESKLSAVIIKHSTDSSKKLSSRIA